MSREFRSKSAKSLRVSGPLSRAFGANWRDTTTATQVYTVHDLYPFLADEIIRRGLPKAG